MKRLIRLALALAALGVTFYGGARFGRFYGRNRSVYAMSAPDAARMAFARAVGYQKSYSQLGQDLWTAYGVAHGKKNGYYVDVGSADGEVISNTKLLDDMGWKGVCIDPFAHNMARRTCQVFKQPVFSESGKRVQFRAAGDLGGIESELNQHKGVAGQAPLVDFVTATLDELLAKARAPGNIDFMSVDVEGAEYDALLGLSFDRYRVASFAIEHNYEPAKRENIHRLLASKGYLLVRSWSVDDWYVHRDFAAPFRDYLSFCSSLTTCGN